MKKTRISLKKENKGVDLASQEQDLVLPLVRELEDAELDFVAGGKMNDMGGIHTTGYTIHTTPLTQRGILRQDRGF